MHILGTLLALTATLLTVDVAPSASATTYAQIEGSGSTWSELIVQQWVADVDSQGMKVVYSAGGSTKGRRDFGHGSTDFAITEIPFQGVDETGVPDTAGDREFAYVPLVAGGTAFSYHLEIGDKLVRNLRLSGRTIAKIFTNRITSWDDPAIAADNNGRRFPALPITPVVRADGAGSTAQVTTWMDTMYPAIWRPYLGRAGWTSYYPKKAGSSMISQSGSDAVMNTIRSRAGNGTIGYVEYTYPLNADYPAVQVLNEAGYFVEPTQYNVAVALTGAVLNDDLTADLGGVYTNPDRRAYPLSSYSYLVLPTGADDPRMTTAKRQTLVDFVQFSICDGQLKAGPYGYSPLTMNLVQSGFDQLAKLADADPDVDLSDRNLRSCHNPTFDGEHPEHNVLAEVAPMPQACQKRNAGPCGTTGPPVSKERPTITGQLHVGATVKADPGRWTGADGFRYQWLADGSPIAGASRRSYVIAAGLRGAQLAVRVTARSAEFQPRTATSATRRVG